MNDKDIIFINEADIFPDESVSSLHNPPVKGKKELALRASDVEVKDVSWLWQDILVKGGLNSIQGGLDIGKTYMTCSLCAAVSNGGEIQSVNGGYERIEQGNVLYLSGDDNVETTLVPRLQELGANLDNIFFQPIDYTLPIIGSKMFEMLVADVSPLLIVVDTLQHFMPSKVSLNSLVSVTKVMNPLKEITERYDCAALLIQHISKAASNGKGGPSVNYANGSAGINGLCRTVWTLGELYGDDGKPSVYKGLACSKANLVKRKPPCLIFSLTEEAGFQWEGIDYDITAEDLYKPRTKTGSGNKRVAVQREQAEDFLTETLSAGDMSSTEIFEMAEDVGISKETLRDAKNMLNVKVYQDRSTTPFHWRWKLNDSNEEAS